MKLAKIENGKITEVKHFKLMFPNTSFAATGPDEAFLAQNSVKKVRSDLQYDPKTQMLVSVEPYILNNQVYDVVVKSIPRDIADSQKAALLSMTISALNNEAKSRLNAFAQERGYEDIVTACSYTNSTVESYASDARKAVAVRDAWWMQINQIVNEMQQGTREVPNDIQSIIDTLPPLSWS